MSDVFISYARDDQHSAEQLARFLGDQGWDVWWDRELVAGREYDRVIEQELQNAKAVLVLWSAASIDSRWVRSEATAAAERGVMVPVLLKGAQLPLAFRTIHAIDLGSWDGSPAARDLDWVAKAVRSLAGPPVAPPQPAEPITTWFHDVASPAEEPRPAPAASPATKPAPAQPVKPPPPGPPPPSVPASRPPAPPPTGRPPWLWLLLGALAVVAIVGLVLVLMSGDDGGGGDGGSGDGGGGGDVAACGPAIGVPFPCQSDDVRLLEERLQAAGFDVQPNEIYGSDGQAALVAFEACAGFTADGVVSVGEAEWVALADFVERGLKAQDVCV